MFQSKSSLATGGSSLETVIFTLTGSALPASFAASALIKTVFPAPISDARITQTPLLLKSLNVFVIVAPPVTFTDALESVPLFALTVTVTLPFCWIVPESGLIVIVGIVGSIITSSFTVAVSVTGPLGTGLGFVVETDEPSYQKV